MDCFALLGQERRPWIEGEALKAAFLARSAEAHPDRAHGGTAAEREAANARYAELNAAYNCLREPKERLAHLVELETGRKPENAAPSPAAAEFFFTMAPTLQGADQFLKERGQARSPLAKAQLFAGGLAWSDKLMELQKQIQLRREGLEAELRQMNVARPTEPALARAAQLSGEFSFMKRWSEQIQERLGRLASE
jgi:curved DNA-binding protein CbpA